MIIKKINSWALLVLVIFILVGCRTLIVNDSKWVKTNLLFDDSGTNQWQEKWMLDGLKAKVKNSDRGMELIAGLEHGNDSCHAVLWTKKSFKGNICIEYDFTRTDSATSSVNIIYFLATGKGDKMHPEDISKWNNLRTVPHMYTYFDNMNTYHISYAAYDGEDNPIENDYVRLRRYNPNTKGLNGSEVPGEYTKTGFFKPYITYKIQVYKFENTIEMHVSSKNNPSNYLVCKWDVSMFPQCESGRIGLRQMYTRNAIYKNFKVWQLK